VAISKGYLDIAQALLDSGIDPNVEGLTTTPLKEAILGGHSTFARYLIDRNVDVDARGTARLPIRRFGQIGYLTPLQAAVDTGLEDIVKVLLVKGADPNDGPGHAQGNTSTKTYDCGTALVRAARLGNIHIILALLDHGADLELCGPITPLQMAIEAGHIRVAKLLLDKGAKVRPSSDGDTVWSSAATRLQDTTLFMKLLLDYGADVNCCPSPEHYSWQRFETALVTAVRSSNLDGTRFLLDNGATLAGKNERDGKTVLQLAASNGDLLIFDLLIERGAEMQELADSEVGCLPLAGEFL
jgi:ankyrin repeat protein